METEFLEKEEAEVELEGMEMVRTTTMLRQVSTIILVSVL